MRQSTGLVCCRCDDVLTDETIISDGVNGTVTFTLIKVKSALQSATLDLLFCYDLLKTFYLKRLKSGAPTILGLPHQNRECAVPNQPSNSDAYIH